MAASITSIEVSAVDPNGAVIAQATADTGFDSRQQEAFTPTEYGKDKYESVAADQLKAFIERIERLEEEKAGVAGDIREIFSEAKANGFDTKIMRRVIALRKKDRAERQEEEAILELYLQALGMD